MSDPEEYVLEAVEGELMPEAARRVLETDHTGPCFGVLGLDSDDRVVVYVDDGMLYHYPCEDGEVVRDPDHPDCESEWLRHTPHHGEGVVQSLDTSGWHWIHPRYRWVTNHAPGRKLETEREG